MSLFSAIGLGIQGAGLVSSWFGQSAAKKARDDQMRQNLLFQEQALNNQQLFLDQFNESQEYNRGLNTQIQSYTDLNRLIAEEEQRYGREQVERNRGELDEQQAYEVERQIKADKDAARQLQFRLDQIAKDETKSQEERDWAISQLEYVKAIASGERDEELNRLYQDRMIKQQEYAYQTGNVERARNDAAAERATSLANRQRIQGFVQELRDALTGAKEGLGLAPQRRQV